MTKKHLLVVDDDRSLRRLLQALLETYGYTSDTAENDKEAMSKLARTHYDAILLDYMMPGVNGLTVLGHIHQRYSSPVVMVTGHNDGLMADHALAAGARACLSKPLDLVKFKKVLTQILG